MPASLFQETPKRGPWSGPDPQPEAGEPVREPMFNAPWTAVALVAVIVGGYAIQARLPEFQLAPFVFSPAGLAAGAWWTPLTAVFLHGSWTHALTNAALVLAFGTPVARLFGTRIRGVLGFFTFYMACGILASLGYAAVHWGSQEGMVGASGAASGLVAAAARLVAGRGRLGGIFAPFVLIMGAAWLVVNLLVAGVMLAGASNLIPGAGGAGVAWEAHLAGFVAGALLIGPFAKLAGRS